MNLNEFADLGSKKNIWYIKPIDDWNWTHLIHTEYVFKIYAVDRPVLQTFLHERKYVQFTTHE